MNTHRRACAVGLAVLTLSACSLGGRDDSRTIASLSERPVELAAEVPSDDSARKAVEAYRRFLEASPQSALRPEAIRRLADLERELYEERQLALGDEGDAAEPSDAAFVPLYEELYRDHPNDPRADQVMYQLSRSYEDAGRRGDAIAMLDELVQRRPGSPLAAEAQFRRGEILFVDGDHAGAAAAYNEVLSHGEASPFFEHAQYKLGWAYFKLSQYDRSLDAFTAMLDHKLGEHTKQEDLSRADRERVDDTLRAMGLAFIYQGGTESAVAYYGSRGGRTYETIVFAKLGEIYLDKEQYTDAAGTYQAFVGRNPFHYDAPAFHTRVIEAYVQADFKGLVLEAKETFVATYRLGAPYWAHFEPAERPDVLRPLKANVSDLASHYHALAQGSGKADDYKQAERWYRVYIDSFPEDPGTPGINFLLAEALFEQGRFPEAVAEYERTAYEYPPHEKSSEAGYAALLAYAEAAKPLQGEQRLAWDRRATDSALLFEVSFPEHPQSAAVLTKASEELYRFGEAGRANEAARRMLATHEEATPELQRTAWTVVGHSDFDLANYAEAELAYREVLQRVPAGDEQRGDLVERMAASVYKQGESARDQGDLAVAAGHFLRVGQVAPSSEITAVAQYDAAAAYLALSNWGQAASVLEGFRSAYPTHELRGEVDRKLAAAYLNDGQIVKAAGEFENLGLAGTGSELEAEGLQQSADLYRQAGARADEARVLVSYVKRFPSPLEPAVEARYRLAELAREGGQT
ncbi:MAG: tetratricopeptide repeat protein, partial [Chromatiales bacterium]